MGKQTVRARIKQDWKRMLNMIDHVIYYLHRLDNYYVGYEEHQNVVRLLAQMIIDAQQLAEKFYKEKV